MFCTNCGSKLNGSERFCSSCGTNVASITNALEKESFKNEITETEQIIEEKARIVFTSKILLGGNMLRPDHLIIERNNLIYEKRNKHLIGVDRVMIPISRIASVEIDRRLISSRIIIYSKGDRTITAENFSINDARKIKIEIQKRM